MTTQLPLLIAITAGVLPANEVAPLSVCEAIANRVELHGKVVEIRGRVEGGAHGISLLPSAPCPQQLVTRGVAWPNVVNLTFPDKHSPDPDDHAPFEPELQSFQAAEAAALKSGYRAGIGIEIATYTGLFVTYRDLEKRVNPGRLGMLRLGFGPAGTEAPVQLLMKSVKDVSVIRKPAKPAADTVQVFSSRRYGFSVRYPGNWRRSGGDHFQIFNTALPDDGGGINVIVPVEIAPARVPQSLEEWAQRETDAHQFRPVHWQPLERTSAGAGLKGIELAGVSGTGLDALESIDWFFAIDNRMFLVSLCYRNGIADPTALYETLKEVANSIRLIR